ncbi:MAG: hypothetical protein MZW92_74520 [Comamonadaceae bacterium]|nr:hypothetical protein [Comamonadaceae bacterium]
MRALGVAVVELGGGRRRGGDAVDPPRRPRRARRCSARRCARASRWRGVHARDAADAENAVAAVQAAIGIADAAPRATPWLHERIDA